MSSNIVINSSHWSRSQSKFIFPLRIPQKFENKQVGLASISIYNQFFNISSANNNNQITLKWINGTNYTYTIPDGYYSCTDINYFFQNKMLKDKLYLAYASSSTKAVYYAEFVIDPNLYSIQINTYAVPNPTNATSYGLALPKNASWSLPVNDIAPQIQFNSAFGKLIGYSAGTYPSSIQNTDTQNLSDKTPEISIVNSLIIRCNLVNNLWINPTDCLNALPLTGSFGDLMSVSGGFILYSDICSNQFNQIEITITDQNGIIQTLIDPDCLIVLSIKNK